MNRKLSLAILGSVAGLIALSWITQSGFLSALFGANSIEAAPPQDEFSPATFGVPAKIGGFKVLAALTKYNSQCLGEIKILYMQANTPTIADLFHLGDAETMKKALQEYNSANRTEWELQIIGPGTRREDLISTLRKSNDSYKGTGCMRFGPPPPHEIPTPSKPPKAGSKPKNPLGYEIKDNVRPDPGWVTDLNEDAFFAPDMIGRAANLVAPFIGPKQTDHSGFLVNDFTDDSYLLQSGLGFKNDGSGHVLWADNHSGLVGIDFGIPYIVGHTYQPNIQFYSGDWFLCSQDTSNPAHTHVTTSQLLQVVG